MTTTLDISAIPQHLVLTGVSWSFYEHTLAEINDHSLRIAFLDGMMEIMSITPEHELASNAIADLIKALAVQWRIPRKALGSTTFRREEKRAGTEPDECFYFYDIEAYKGIKRFEPAIHRAPDLWIEVDIFSPSVAREPIYARLGVPEIWRYSRDRVIVRILTSDGIYADSPTSLAFPLLPMAEFASFIQKMIEGDESSITLEFQDWVRTLPNK